MSQPTEQNIDALTELQVEFTRWRNGKTNSRQRIPESLLLKAARLSDHLDDLQVRKALGVTGRQWDRIRDLRRRNSQPVPDFVEVGLPVPAHPQADVNDADNPSAPASVIQITISLPDGASVTIAGIDRPVSRLVESILEGAC